MDLTKSNAAQRTLPADFSLLLVAQLVGTGKLKNTVHLLCLEPEQKCGADQTWPESAPGLRTSGAAQKSGGSAKLFPSTLLK